MGTENNKDERSTPEYLSQLLKDKKQLQAFPNVFVHMERLLDDGKYFFKVGILLVNRCILLVYKF